MFCRRVISLKLKHAFRFLSDYIEDICPYATFQLSKPPYSESTYSGNVYSGPYHSVQASFVYHDPKVSALETYKLRHVSNL